MLRAIAYTFTILLTLSACTASYNRQDTGGLGLQGTVLDPSKSILVATPADGSYQDKPYPGSGVTVAQQTAAAFSRYARKVDTASPRVADKTDLLEMAKRGSFGYLVVPVVAHWEHRATAWSGIPSTTAVAISVYDALTGEKLHSTQLEARSRIISWTSTSPESLLPGMFNGYVSGLYGQTYK